MSTVVSPSTSLPDGGSSVVFIDSRISNLELVVAGLAAGTRWVLIDAEQDGLTQIAAALQGASNLQSIQVLSHGGPGSLLLGSGSITSSTLQSQSALLASIGAALAPQGDLLLYGCNVAQGDTGAQFIALLAQLTGADTAASSDLTGDAALGGDWVLEVNTGEIETNGFSLTPQASEALGVLATVEGTSGNDTVNGTVSADTITGLAGDDSILGDDGNDSIDGGEGNDILEGNAGDDVLKDDFGNSTMYGGLGNDTLSAMGQSVSLDGGDGSDRLIVSGSSVITLSPYLVTYILHGSATLIGGAGDDSLETPSLPGQSGLSASHMENALLQGGDGHDRLQVTSTRGATLEGGAGQDTLTSTNFLDGVIADQIGASRGTRLRFDGGADNDTLSVSGSASTYSGLVDVGFEGGTGNDSLTVYDWSSSFGGASGAIAYATLSGGDGDDTLTASGVLQLTLTGGAGSDTFALTGIQQRTIQRVYSFTTGTAPTTASLTVTGKPIVITDFTAGTGGDVIDLSDLLATGTGGDIGGNPFGASGYLYLQQSLTNPADAVLLFDADGVSGTASTWLPIAVLNGVSVSALTPQNFSPLFDSIVSPLPPPPQIIVGTALADSLIGGDLGDSIDGLGGNDTIYGADGDDLINGGDGNDSLEGNAGNDSINGSAGNDTAYGGEGNDTLIGGAGNDSLWGNAGNDLLIGGTGNDFFYPGDGADTIDGSPVSKLWWPATAGDSDTLSYTNWAPSGTLIDLSARTVSVIGQSGVDSFSGIENIWGASNAPDVVTGRLTSGISDYTAGGSSIVLTLFGGSDTVSLTGYGYQQPDVDGVTPLSYVPSATGISVSYSNNVGHVSYGAAGSQLAGADTVFNVGFLASTRYSDVLDMSGLVTNHCGYITAPSAGNSFNMVFVGYGGSDTVIGNGQTWLYFGSTNSSTGSGVNIDLRLTSTDLSHLSYSSGGVNSYSGTLAYSGINGLYATAFNDTLIGSDKDDLFRGYAGNDLIDGGQGFDRADYKYTNSGSTFLLATGLVSTANEGQDTLRSIENIAGTSYDDVFDATGFESSAQNIGSYWWGYNGFVEAGGSDLIIGNGATRLDYGKSLVAIDVDLIAGYADARLEADKSSVLYNTMGRDTLSGVFDIRGSAFDDLLAGGGAGNTHFGMPYESFTGGAGSDTIDGRGGLDNAQYDASPEALVVNMRLANGQVINDGWGFTDTLIDVEGIVGTAYNDSVRGSDSATARIRFSGSKGNDSFDGGAGTATIGFQTDDAGAYVRLAGWVGSTGALPTGFTGSAIDGWGSVDVFTNVDNIEGSNFNDTLIGDANNNVIDGRGGSDSLDGGLGIDTLEFNQAMQGIRVSLLDGRVYDDGQGIGNAAQTAAIEVDTVTGFENVSGGFGNDSIIGDAGSNVLQGIDGNDSLYGQGGDDTLVASLGNDMLEGGSGADIFSMGSGYHRINDFGSGDTIGISHAGFSASGPVTLGNGSSTAINQIELESTPAGVSYLYIGLDSIAGADQTIVLGGNYSTTQFSVASSWIQYVNTSPTGTVAISLLTPLTGLKVGSTLSASNTLTDADGIGPISYQWRADNADIAGATSSLFTLTYAQVGKAISVAASYTDGGGTLETVGSSPTALVVSEITGTSNPDSLVGGDLGDSIYGLGGSDTIYGNAGGDAIQGGNGNDTIYGGAGNDTIDGGSGNDFMMGDAGDDLLVDYVGSDWFSPGDGNDVVDFGSQSRVPWAISASESDQISYEFWSPNGTQIDLSARTVSVIGYSGIDTYNGAEQINGGRNTSDLITGRTSSSVADYSTGGSSIGLYPLGGSDTISITGYGYQQPVADGPFVYYHTMATGISVNYSDNVGYISYGASGTQIAGTDTITNVAYFSTTNFSDTLDLSGLVTNHLGHITDPLNGDSWNWLYVGLGGSDTVIGNGQTYLSFSFITGTSNGSGVNVDLRLNAADLSHLSYTRSLSVTNSSTLTTNSGHLTYSGVYGLAGTSFDDTLIGADTNDLLRGLGGNDSLDGGAGFDRADYRSSSAGITFNMASGLVSSINEGQDILRSIENVRGTYYDDVFDATGFESSTQNVGSYWWGYNGFLDLGGNDQIIGNGATRVDYSASLVAIDVDLMAGYADARLEADKSSVLYSTMGQDTLSGVFYVRGSVFDDQLAGGGEGNAHFGSPYESFSGGAGNDTINGRGGWDNALYDSSPEALVVDMRLATGQVINDGWGFTDTLVDIEGIVGTAYSDSVRGSDSSTARIRFSGSKGNDSIDGGAGTATIGFQTDDAGAYVRLAGWVGSTGALPTGFTGSAIDGWGTVDVFTNVDNIEGSNFNDTLIGDANNNVIDGRGGNDSIDGGLGTDTLEFNQAMQGIRVSLLDGRVYDDGQGIGNAPQTAAIEVDTVTGFENVSGGYANDSIIGNTSSNMLQGNDGNDSLFGGAGGDRLDGNAGDDSLYGEDGNDGMYGGPGNDLLSGGLGNDTFTGGEGSDTIIGSAMTAVPWPVYTADFDVLRIGYSSSQIDLSARTVSVAGEAGIDSYVGIEEIHGGINATDIVTGRTSDVVMDYVTEGSRVTLRLFGGSDTVSIAGYGYQQPFADGARVNYDWSATGIHLSSSGNLATVEYGASADQIAGVDSLANVGLISGTSFDDILDTSGLVTNQWGYFTRPAIGKSWTLLYVGDGGSDTIIGNGHTFAAFDQVSSSSNGLGLSFDLRAGTADASHLSGYNSWNGTRPLGTTTFSGVDGISGTRFADTLVGGLYDEWEWFRGNGGNDLIDGGAGFDRADYTWASAGMTFNLLSGVFSSVSEGQDTVRGIEEIRTTRFDDTFNASGFVGGFTSTVTNIGSLAWGLNAYVESGGNDIIIGNGNTRIEYTNSLVAIEADLAAGFVDARIPTDKASDLYKTLGRDTVSGVYAIRGSAFDDLLQGGGSGGGELATPYESFRGEAGNDTIDGRAGVDLAEYGNSPNAISVNLGLAGAQVIQDGWGFSDTLVSVENVSGSYANDSIIGDAGSNVLQGNHGNDSLLGEGGDDTLEGGEGDDSLQGGQGDDVLEGGTGLDVAVFSGAQSNYAFLRNLNGSITVSDLRAATVSGFDGTDTLSDIETLRFGDALVQTDPAAPTGTVTISGNAAQGQTLSATNTLADLNGLGAIAYQWKADGVSILGATSTTLTLSQDQVGKAISLVASYTDASGTLEVVSSALTSEVTNIDDEATGTLSVTGTAQEGGSLSASLTAISDLDGATTTAYRWQENTGSIGTPNWVDLSGATSATLSIPSDQSFVGKSVRVVATTTDALRGTTEFASAAQSITNVNDAPTGAVTIAVNNGHTTANLAQGDTLTASNTLTDADGIPVSGTNAIAYQWKANGLNIVGATASSYVLTATEVGKTITVSASYVDNQGTPESVVSATSAAVAPPPGLNLIGTSAANLLNGSAFNDTISGLGGNDTLNGLAGDDWLDGGAGNDSMVGGTGDDTYIVDSSSDVIAEQASQGTDLIRTALATYTLPTHVENLVYTGSAAFTGNGNTLNNAITGGNGADTLSGGSGSDTMTGGAGNDTYVVDVATDVIVELASGGTDTVRTALTTYTLGAELENLTYTGTVAFVGQGNELSNVLTGAGGTDQLRGGSGNDTLTGGTGNDSLWGEDGQDSLDGGTGNDSMTGGTGDDTYVVDASGDVLVELAAGGIDTVRTSLASYTLGTELENLVYTGAGGFTANGNTLANGITGAAGADNLSGLAGSDTLTGNNGNDTLRGGDGADVMSGGAGNDRFVYATIAESGIGALLRDLITDLSVSADRIDLSAIDANTSTGANDAFTWRGTAAITAAGQLNCFYEAATNTTVIQGNVDANLAADFSIGVTGNLTASLVAATFVL